MRTICKLLPLILLASAISLSSCVNQIKDAPKAQAQDTTKGKDTLTKLAIIYSIPDSNNILNVTFHASLVAFQKYFRLDWDFGDSSGIISQFDTNAVDHNFKSFGLHIVSLSVTDIQTKAIVRKMSDTLTLIDNEIDTNFLHQFTKFSLYFSGQCNCIIGGDSSMKIVYDSTTADYFDLYKVQWNGNHFQLNSYQGYHNVEGTISFTGSRIDSGKYSYQANSGWVAFGTHSFSLTFSVRYIDFNSLDQVYKGTDSLVFFYNGSNLSSRITSLLDTAGSIVTTAPLPFAYPLWLEKMDVDWNKQPSPILRIKFYK